jgi:hypothetical protein
VLSLALVTISSKLIFYMLQGFYHHTIPSTASLQVPLLISFLTLLSLVLLATSGSHSLLADRALGDENDDLLRAMKFSKGKKKKTI